MLNDQRSVCWLNVSSNTCVSSRQFDLQVNEMIVNIVGGWGGLVILTSSRGIYFQTGARSATYILLEEIRVNYEQIRRVEVNMVPIFYLVNGTVIAYGQNDQPYGCVDNVKKNFYRLIEKASRFVPYAYTENNVVVSIYLNDEHKLMACKRGDEPQELTRVN